MLALVAAPVVICCAALISGQKPDFSGLWALGPNTSVAVNFGGLIAGSVIRIEQTADAIRIRRTYGRESLQNPPVILTVSLDDRESPNAYHGVHRPGISATISSKARWDGNRLVLVTIQTMTDADKKTSTKRETTETLSLDAGRLIVERAVSPDPDKSQGRKEIWFKQ